MTDIPTAYIPVPASYGYATILPDMDFETYSEAGYNFDKDLNKWISISKSAPHGLGAVGAAAYSEHPSTEILCLAYDLKDGRDHRLWLPGMSPPQELFNHIAAGGLIEAWNSMFEYLIWENVCYARMGWPKLPLESLRCAMSKSYAFSLPGALGKAAGVVNVPIQKLKDGARLIKKFSCVRNPTKKDARLRIRPPEDLVDAEKLYNYCSIDIKTEAALSRLIPDLSPEELKLWLLDQKINARGVSIDMESLQACISIIEQITAKYTTELFNVTGGAVSSGSEIQKIITWLRNVGVHTNSIDVENVKWLLDSDNLPPAARRVLEIRSFIGASSVKKLFSISKRVSRDGRMRGLFQYHGAGTGRFAGRGPQPHNLPTSGPNVHHCICGRYYKITFKLCPRCLRPSSETNVKEWNIDSVSYALEVIKRRDIDLLESILGDPVAVVSGCLRGLFCATSDKDLICSDYSAIEAVILAVLAGEQWRIDVFNTHGKIYEMSASKITGIPFQEFLDYKINTGNHHPARKKIGKVSELASGYQGSVGAWKAFGADKHIGDDEKILAAVRKWRADSPNIVNFWYKIEDAARSAIQFPGRSFGYRGIYYQIHSDTLFCQLPSGRKLCYHSPRLTPDVTPWGKEVLKISYMCWNTDPKKGPSGWIRVDTYGGKLTENIVQAIARDILTYAMVNLENAGYPIVLHVHDEIVAEILKSFGSIKEFEKIMNIMPPWAQGWPIRATGGWRGKRYRKE
jgi:DNA polymerase